MVKHTLVLMCIVLFLSGALAQAQGAPPRLEADLPLADGTFFIENVGQYDPQVLFLGWTDQGGVSLLRDGLGVLVTAPRAEASIMDPRRQWHEAPPASDAVRLRFVGANPTPQVLPLQRLGTQVAYFSGSDPSQWYSQIPTWGGVRYAELYPGIDLVLAPEHGRLVQRIEARAGADVGQVRVAIEGAETARVDGAGLHLTTAHGATTLPLLELTGAAAQRSALGAPRLVGMELAQPFGQAPPAPQALQADFAFFNTYDGGGSEWINQLSVDWSTSGANTTYFTGVTSSASGFPTQGGDTGYNGGNNDAFVGSITSAGALRFLSFLGGSGWETGYGLALRRNSGPATDQVAVVGYTNSPNFPTTPNTYDATGPTDQCTFGQVQAPCYDAFVLRLSTDGQTILASTYLGSTGHNYATTVWVGAATGDIWVGGQTSGTMPVPANMYQSQRSGGQDGFWLHMNPLLASAPDVGTYFGGSNDDDVYSLMVDQSSQGINGIGDVVITGLTYSSNNIASSGAYDTTFNGSGDIYLARFSANGQNRSFGTYFGGAGYDASYRLFLEWDDEIYLAGVSDSNNLNFVELESLDDTYNGKKDAVIVRFSNTGDDMQFGSYWGGAEDDYAYDVTRDVTTGAGIPPQQIYVIGITRSRNMLVSYSAQYCGLLHNPAGMLLKFDGSFPVLPYSTYVMQDSNVGMGLYSVGVDTQGWVYAGGFQNNQNAAAVLKIDSNRTAQCQRRSFNFIPMLLK